jgi:hypothetical protein
VQVICSAEPSGHLAGHIREIQAELDAVGLGHIFQLDCPGIGRESQAA